MSSLAEIEKEILNEIKAPIEKIISEAIQYLNAQGFEFEKMVDDIGLWRDYKTQLELNVTSILSVSCNEKTEADETIDPKQKEIEDRFYAIACSGKDKEIERLSSFEAEIANGGFEQLFLNKGNGFLNEAIVTLEAIGANFKSKLAKEALALFNDHSSTIKQHHDFQKSLSKLDNRYWKSKENLAIIHHKSMTSKQTATEMP